MTISSRQPFCEVAATEGTDLAFVDVALRMEDDGEHTPSAHTVILFHHGPAGWCAAAEVLEPTWPVRLYCETQHELRRVSATELSLRTRRTCYESLDQQEVEAGVSDVTERECVELTYATHARRIEERSRRACESLDP